MMNTDIPTEGMEEQPQPQVQGYNESILTNIENQLDSLAPEQQEFIVQYLTPESAGLLGLILGQEAYDFFSQHANPDMALVPVPRSQLTPLQEQQSAAIPEVDATETTPTEVPQEQPMQAQPSLMETM